jgi:hypothetical protein
MKGEVRPIEPNVSNNNDKKFQPFISTAKVYERNTKVLRQNRDTNFDSTRQIAAGNKATITPDIAIQRIHMGQEHEKLNTKNHFEMFDERLENELSLRFPDELTKITIENKFIYDFFKNLDIMSNESIEYVINEITRLVDEYYNIINDQQANDFIFYFLMIFDNYIILDPDDQKFNSIHSSLVYFFNKALKNRSDEMVFLFKNIFFKKFFETLNNIEYKDKVDYITELIYKIIEPNENQLKDFFKMFKDNITSEMVLIKVFAHLHDLIPILPEHIVDTCLFYVLSGINSPDIDIRYYSLYILHKYMLQNINFYYNFESKDFN